MKILVLNSGSSSIKFQLMEMTGRSVIASGIVEKIGESAGSAEVYSDEGSERYDRKVADHTDGLELIREMLAASGTVDDFDALGGIGHRVVHGGEAFHEPVLIDDEVIGTIDALSSLAPLHNPANLEGIHVAMKLAPHVSQVAVFDTAFHQSIPEKAYLYALPKRLYEEEGVRRYGFHGTSHHYVAKAVAAHLEKPLEGLNLITLHLGNGASACAIKGGRSIDTSMGMTPLEGLVMGTRSGDIDSEILLYLIREKGMNPEALDRTVNKESGLKGLCGSNDMREIIERMEAGDADAATAFEVFVYRIRKYIGAYSAVLGRVDAVIFTGGIGEHAWQVREAVCEDMEGLGMVLDAHLNRLHSTGVTAMNKEASKVAIFAVSTDEELEIAIQTEKLIKGDVSCAK
jgi:acetate kinase